MNTFPTGPIVDVRLAGVETHYLSPPKDINMRVPDKLIKCTGFLSHDISTPKFMGTMFVVGVESELGGGGYLHLVTAKHVAERIDPGPFVIGMNGKDGKPLWLKSGDESRWWYHPTESDTVDVAVIPFASARLPEYDIEWIHESMFLTDETIKKYGIGLGDELTTVGLFSPFYGLSKFIPVVRTGNIAMMPPDPIPTKDFGSMEAYLADMRSIGGLSGSPVLVRNTMNLPPIKSKEGEMLHFSGLGSFHFLGLMHGHWAFMEKEIGGLQTEIHSGISVVVPAKKILEVLHHPELVEMRKNMDKKEMESRYPVADSANTHDEPARFTRDDFETALKKVSRKIGTKKTKGKR
jgi:hypothetical protein